MPGPTEIHHTRWPFSLRAGALAAVAVGVLVLAFSWPAVTAKAQNIDIVLAGPSAQTSALASKLGTLNSALSVTTVADRDEAVTRIENRTDFGGIVLGDAPEVLVASAANASVAAQLRAIAPVLQTQLQAAVNAAVPHGITPPTVTVKVTDVVPLASTDSTGAGLAVSAFPLVMGGMLVGIIVSLLVAGVMRRLAALFVGAAGAGLLVVLVLQTWFGVLQGGWGLNWLAISLAVLGTSSFIVGCTSLLGRAGIAVGAVLTMLVANPISGASTPWQFYPAPWGAIGQFFVPGAGATLVRGLSYFPNADLTQPWLVLIGWAVLGLVLSAAGHFRSRPAMRLPAADYDEGTVPA